MTKETTYRNPFEAENVADEYEGWFETPLGRVVDRLETALIDRLAEPKAGETALDVGTGTGHFARYLAALGLHVTGYDRSEAMLRVARARDDGIVYQQGEAEALPYADDSFDLVLSVTALEFVRDPARAVAEMYRVTTRGGRLVVAVLNAESPWAAFYRRMAREMETPFRHAHFLSTTGLYRLLAPYGRPHWDSAVFVPPSGRGIEYADLLERVGRIVRKGRGALLVGRVDK